MSFCSFFYFPRDCHNSNFGKELRVAKIESSHSFVTYSFRVRIFITVTVCDLCVLIFCESRPASGVRRPLSVWYVRTFNLMEMIYR
jgi:hypothetical protein